MSQLRRPARLVMATALLALVPATHAVAYQVQSPDARDANLAAQRAGDVDLRSPDARDAARGVSVRTVVPVAAPKTHGTGGADTGLVLGGLVGGLALIATGTGMIVVRRRTATVPG